MSDALVTMYRKSANGRIEAIDLKPDEAEHVVERWPFAWSTSSRPESFAKWPWPPERRGAPCDPPNWSRSL
jgi:hypothetical protein